MFASLSDLVKKFESGGNYAATNPGSTASGAYQFINSTWQRYAAAAGVDTSQYPTAASAPASVQDQVFNQAVSQNGLADWTCPGCNPALTSYLAANPGQANVPVFASGDGSGESQFPGANGDSTMTPTSATQPGSGANPAATKSSGGILGGLLTPVWELITRSLVFLFGMAILLIALIALLWQSKTVQVNVKSLGAVAAV